LKRFIFQLVLFLGSYLFLNIIAQLLFPYYYGNSQFREKLTIFKQIPEVNTVFFGSSQTACHFMPQVIDSLVPGCISFNLGAFAVSNPENYGLLEKFINSSDADKIKLVILEIQPLSDLVPKHAFTTRNNYWNNTSEILYAWKYLQTTVYPPSNSDIIPLKYCFNWMVKQIDPFKFKYGLGYHEKKDYGNYFENRGFDPLTDSTTKDFKNFWSDTTTTLRDNALALSNLLTQNRDINTTHYNRLLKLKAIAEERGIQLFFYFPPKRTQYYYAAELIPGLPEALTLNFVSPIEYPELYLSKYAYDLAHLNPEGAFQFSIWFAEKLNERLLWKQ
jgi:hypothetical protein